MNSKVILLSSALLIVIVCLGIIALFITFNNRKNQLIKQKFEDELASQKRQHESALKLLQSQLNPHFVHNSLNAIQYFIQRNEVEISESYLAKFSKLMRLFFEYSRRKTVTLKEEKEFLKYYLSMEKLRFEERLNFKFIVDKQLSLEDCILPAMLLQPMLENTVNHGIFHKPEPGKLEIFFNHIPFKKGFEIIIQDDGIGINKSRELYQENSETTGAHSGQVLKERLDILNESGLWNINYSITDRSALENETGTIIKLTFNPTISWIP